MNKNFWFIFGSFLVIILIWRFSIDTDLNSSVPYRRSFNGIIYAKKNVDHDMYDIKIVNRDGTKDKMIFNYFHQDYDAVSIGDSVSKGENQTTANLYKKG